MAMEAVKGGLKKVIVVTKTVSIVQKFGLLNYKMMLIGETGCGKTSLLNYLCNADLIQSFGYPKGSEKFRSFNDITLENAKAKKMESKTDAATAYSANMCDRKVTIIDTPGFGDSRGLKQDKENAKKIVEALTSEEHVNCICLVINGRLSRMTATLKYVLTEVTAILPRKILDNIIVVFTNCTDILDLTFDPALLEEFFGQKFEDDRIFCIENPYCRLEKAKEKQSFLPHKKIAATLQSSFEKAGEMLTEMCQLIFSFSPVYTYQFGELYDKKQLIEKDTLVLLTEYEYQKSLEAAIEKAKEGAQVAAHKKELHANYESTQEVKRWVTKATSRHNTLCGAPGCFSNCHTPCYLDKSFDKEVFKSCSCIIGDTCRKCKHSYTLHYHNEVEFVETVEEVELIDEKTREQFIKAKNMEEREQILLDEFSRKREESIKKREELSIELRETIVQFEKLGITRNYAKLLENQIAIIEHRLDGEVGSEANDLRKVKEELEKKFVVVCDALHKKRSSK